MKKLLFYLFPVIGFAQEIPQDSTKVNLDQLVLTTTTKTFVNKNGNIKIDVVNSVYKSIPNILDLLSKMPKVQISPDRESISITGKGNPLIYIDNAKAEIADLNALSTDDIKSIEIINNPSSRYEADGRAVILITRKWRKSEGFQTTISETAAFKKAFNNYSGISSNLKIRDTEIRGSFNLNHLKPWEGNSNSYEIPAGNIASDYAVEGFTKRLQYVYGASVFQKINPDDYVSISVNGRNQNDDFRLSTHTLNVENGAETAIRTVGNDLGGRNFLTSVLNYNNKFIEANANLFLGMQYSDFRRDADTGSFNSYNGGVFSPFRSSIQDLEIDAFSVRSDFDKKFPNEMKWETGAWFSITVAKTGLDMTDLEQNENVQSDYRLEEKIAAAYSQLSGNFKKVSWSAGLRVENTMAAGKYKLGNRPLIDKNYLNLFPKMQLDYAIDSTKTLTLNYAKSIARPDYSATSQGMTYINPYFVFSGNTNLNPSVSDEISANFQYSDKSLKIAYAKTKDNINYNISYDESAQLLTNRPENFDKQSDYSIELTYPLKWKFWSATNVFSCNVTEIEKAGATATDVKPYIYYYSNHAFALKNQWTISTTGWGLSKRYQGILVNDGFFTFDVAVSKTYQNWIFSFSANDVFKGMDFRERFNTNAIATVGNYFVDAREFSIGLKYSFGKIKDSKFEEKAVDEEIKRIK